jgi:hypothetical protein
VTHSPTGLRSAWEAIGAAGRISQAEADEIVRAARPHALGALGRSTEDPAVLPVSARLVDPTAARGGSIIPAWPERRPDGSVVIEFVEDWGVLLAAWRCLLAEGPAPMEGIDTLLRGRQRLWVGIANDVLQLFVPDPPEGTYSMVRHHALMLAAATLWLGQEAADTWQAAHARAAAVFLGDGGELWDSVAAAERGLGRLLADSRARAPATAALDWLETDADARRAYRNYLGAASLGLAALLAVAPARGTTDWLRNSIAHEHPRPDFNRAEIEQLARALNPNAARDWRS